MCILCVFQKHVHYRLKGPKEGALKRPLYKTPLVKNGTYVPICYVRLFRAILRPFLMAL